MWLFVFLVAVLAVVSKYMDEERRKLEVKKVRGSKYPGYEEAGLTREQWVELSLDEQLVVWKLIKRGWRK